MNYKGIEIEDNKIIVVVGPTASGKSALSIELAKLIDAEIISCDAFQVYKKMDIGTAKTMPFEMGGIKHHMIDIIDYDEEFNVQIFQKQVRELIDMIKRKNKRVILAGGSGLYIQAVLYDYRFNDCEEFNTLKKELESYPLEKLQSLLKKNNLNNSDFNNHKRLVNYIAKQELNLQISNEGMKKKYDFQIINIEIEREILYNKINQRVDKMIIDGLIQEVKQFESDKISQLAIGYKEVHLYLNGSIDKEEAIELIKKNTRNFAKRQMTWFRNKNNSIYYRKEGEKWQLIKNY